MMEASVGNDSEISWMRCCVEQLQSRWVHSSTVLSHVVHIVVVVNQTLSLRLFLCIVVREPAISPSQVTQLIAFVERRYIHTCMLTYMHTYMHAYILTCTCTTH